MLLLRMVEKEMVEEEPLGEPEKNLLGRTPRQQDQPPPLLEHTSTNQTGSGELPEDDQSHNVAISLDISSLMVYQ